MDYQNEMELNFVELFYYLKKKLWIIVASFLLFAVSGFVVSRFFMTPQYTASTRLYVLNQSTDNVISSDFVIATYVINDYRVLITGRNVTERVIDELGLNMTNGQLAGLIQVTAPDETRILQINVVDTDPQRAAAIANKVREVATEQIKTIMNVDFVGVIYEAEVPGGASSPNVMRNTGLAAVLGLALAIVVLTVIFIADDTIRTEEDVERYLGLSTLGVIPDSTDLTQSSSKTVKKKWIGQNVFGKKK